MDLKVRWVEDRRVPGFWLEPIGWWPCDSSVTDFMVLD